MQLAMPEDGNSNMVPSEVIDEKIEKQEEFEVNPEDQLLVHGSTGLYLMSKDKWPNLNLPFEINRSLTEDSSQVNSQERRDAVLKDQMVLSTHSMGEVGFSVDGYQEKQDVLPTTQVKSSDHIRDNERALIIGSQEEPDGLMGA